MNYAVECQRQAKLHWNFVELEGLSLIEDPFSLEDKIGTVQDVIVTYDGRTPKGLLRFYIKGERNLKAFHLLDSFLVEHWLGFPHQDFVVGQDYTLRFVIGVRRVGNMGYVISLRLPQR